MAMDMPLSIEKCLVLHCGLNNPQYQYQCGGGVLPATDSLADLGIIRSADGTYSEHISAVAQKGRRLVGMCFRGIRSRDPVFLMRVYRAYILPVLSYASPIWTLYLCQDVDELESVQRLFTKRLAGMKNCSYGTRLRNLSLLSLESQREYTDLITVYKLIHGMMGVSLDDTGLKLSSNCTRSGGTRLQQLEPTTTLCASRFKFRAASMWNSLPWEAYQLPRLAMFKSYVKQKLLNDDQAYFD